MSWNPLIFREYDIRGVVDKDFDEDFAYKLGLAYAKLVRLATSENGKLPTLAVGRDCRLSSDSLAAALSRGLCEGGVNVMDTGIGPTPQLYFAVFSQELAGGIQVTGSHNPKDQNGFKMMVGNLTLSGAEIKGLRDQVSQTEADALATASGMSSKEKGEIAKKDMRSHFIADLIERSKPYIGQRKIKVVTDGGNGVGGLVGPAVLRGLGCEVIELFSEPDGNFPNHHPDPTEMENLEDLIHKVKETKADFGIAWDGDADRIGVVDENGLPVFGDLLLLIFGRQILREVPGATIIGDVKCSDLLFDDLTARGANAVMGRTGHSLVKALLKETGGALAGEMSGHIFFAHRYFGFDDAIHAAARLIEIVSNFDGQFSGLLADLPQMINTPEIRLDCPDTVKFKVAEAAKEAFKEWPITTVDGVRIKFPNGWGLVRASNTQPVLVLRFEASSEALLKEYERLVKERLNKILNDLE